MNFTVIAVPNEISTQARISLVSPQFSGLKADVGLATGYGPCRSCLKVFEQGQDKRIYITYNSFDGLSNLPDPGPIFIHKDDCTRFEETFFPSDLLGIPIFLEGFGDESTLQCREKMIPDSVESQIRTIFTNPLVRFINLRNAEAGCFIARVERQPKLHGNVRIGSAVR